MTRPALFSPEQIAYAMGKTPPKPNGSYGVAYVTINADDYEKLMEAVKREPVEYVKPETAAKMFECNVKTLSKMADQHIINRYAVPGFVRMVRYRVDELNNAFKKI